MATLTRIGRLAHSRCQFCRFDLAQRKQTLTVELDVGEGKVHQLIDCAFKAKQTIVRGA